MSEIGDQLARLRAHVEGRLALPPDLGGWVLDQLAAGLRAEQALAARDALIRLAARQLPGVPHRKAAALAAEARRLDRMARPPEPGTVAALLVDARRYRPLPSTPRHYCRLLQRD